MTSNKSLIGHTGWAAGAVSVIEGILGLQNATIPPQHQFDEPPADFGIETTSLTIPKAPVPWPSEAGRAASPRDLGLRLRRHERTPRARGVAVAGEGGAEPGEASV